MAKITLRDGEIVTADGTKLKFENTPISGTTAEFTSIVAQSLNGDGSDLSNVVKTTNVNQSIDGIKSFSNSLGIGTSSPGSYSVGATKLVVADSTDHVGITLHSNPSSQGRIYFGDALTTGVASRQGQIVYDHNTDDMFFATSYTERVRIDNVGNVGIGTTSPSYKLHVGGTFGVSSTSIFFGDATFSGLLRHGNNTIDLFNSSDMVFKVGYAGGDFRFTDTSNNNLLFVSQAGDVGIGTISPSTKLEVNGTITATAFSGDGSLLTGLQAGEVSGELFDINTVGGNEEVSVSVGTTITAMDGVSAQTVNSVPTLSVDSSVLRNYGDQDITGLKKFQKALAGTNYALDGNTVTVIENNSHGYITFATPATSKAGILFNDGNGTYGGALLYDHSANAMDFRTNGGTKMYVDSSGEVGIGTVTPNKTVHLKQTSPSVRLESTVDSQEFGIYFDYNNASDESSARIVVEDITNQTVHTSKLCFYTGLTTYGPAMYMFQDSVFVNNSLQTYDLEVTNQLTVNGFETESFESDTFVLHNDKLANESGAGSSLMRILASSNGVLNGIQFEDPNNSSVTAQILFQYAGSNRTLSLQHNNSHALTLHGSGRVGIGETTSDYTAAYGLPGSSLGVAGGLFVSSDTILNSDLEIGGYVTGPIKIKQVADTNSSRSGLRIYESNTSAYWSLYMHDYATNTGTYKDNYLAFYYTREGGATFPSSSGLRGFINADATGGSLNFTGQHRSRPENNDVESFGDKIGLIVCSTGEYASLGGNAITINEALPKVKLADARNKKSVFGVISDKEDSSEESREYVVGNFVSVNEKPAGDDRLIINSIGEGAIWVCNINGDLENGDYITSCEISGHGMKQDDDLLHNYTVAKITCDCDFDLNSQLYTCEEFQWEGQTYRKAFVGCTYHCGQQNFFVILEIS